MTRPVSVQSLVRVHVPDDARVPDQDLLAVEAPLLVQVAPSSGDLLSLGVLMRTPGHDDDLAIGALVSEGVLSDAAQVRTVRLDDDTAIVSVTADANVAAIAGRGASATSACGLCGRLEVLALDGASGLMATSTTAVIAASTIAALPEALRSAQPAFAATGGLHAAALVTYDGAIEHLREDVGRHNAVDKVIGARLRAAGLPAADRLLMVSGRVAYEIVQKAARAGIPIVAAIGAPTDLAVDAARSAGITLVGFVRHDRFNVYTCPDRIT